MISQSMNKGSSNGVARLQLAAFKLFVKLPV